VIKTDSEFHGDDHFFPGPTDIAWDLAGLAIEWEMEEESVEVLIREYQRLTGDDPGRRFSSYLLAYSVFRFAYCKMGSQATAGTIDEALLRQDYERYRRRASQHVWLNRSCAA
jgi:2-keto-3-deoxy-L-rhamnonate aldolase RhmA